MWEIISYKLDNKTLLSDNKEMNRYLLAAVFAIALLVVGAGAYFLINQQPGTDNPNTTSVSGNNQTSNQIEGYSGALIAGKDSPYVSFNKSDYDKALADGKIVFLDFYANWCPICRAEAPEIISGFNELQREDIVGFRVNYNDDETDDSEKALAKEFDIPYQHTKVILENGSVILKDGNTWDKEKFLEELNKI